MIWHEHVHVLSIATAAGKKLLQRYLCSSSKLLTLYKLARIRPSLECCSLIWGAAAPTTLSILDAVQRMAIRFFGHPTLTYRRQPLSHWRAVGDLSLLPISKRILPLRANIYNSGGVGFSLSG
nr:unnamed protein product [Callosobruchus chinensis]